MGVQPKQQQASERTSRSQRYSTENRLTAVETRWESIVPNLATKADLADMKADLADMKADLKDNISRIETKSTSDIAELRADIHKMDATFARWMLTTVIALIVGFGGMFFALQRSIDITLTRIERLYVTQQPPAAMVSPAPVVTPLPAQQQD